MTRFLFLSLILSLGCGDDLSNKKGTNTPTNNPDLTNNPDPSNNPTPEDNNVIPRDPDTLAYTLGFNAPWDAHSTGEQAVFISLEAVVAASVQANGGETLVTTGTLDISGQAVAYSASPTDRLVIKWAQGPDSEIWVSQLNGNFEASSVAGFLGDDHVLGIRYVQGQNDFEVLSEKVGTQRQARLTGSIQSGEQVFNVQLNESGTTRSVVDITTAEYESDSVMTGTITGPGFELESQESFRYKSVVGDRGVVNQTRTGNSAWTYNGNSYQAADVLVRTAETDGWPDDADYWQASGTLVENGIVIGEVGFEEDPLSIDVVLQMSNGEKAVLRRFMKYQE